jgi:hypothetical protein
VVIELMLLRQEHLVPGGTQPQGELSVKVTVRDYEQRTGQI